MSEKLESKNIFEWSTLAAERQLEIERLNGKLSHYEEEIERLRAANKDLQEKYLGTREGRINDLRGEPK